MDSAFSVIAVRLTALAFIHGKPCAPEQVVHVSPARAAELESLSAAVRLDEIDTEGPIIGNADIADLTASRLRLQDVEAENRSLQARNHELEAEIAELLEAAAKREAEATATTDAATTDTAAADAAAPKAGTKPKTSKG